ncbi:hypothetical protein Slala03_72070 [Streptomyces lavendulae subsp. lavendulae]|nr:hypothetical protein Slala03_72070 [Streptomyces lavendulae subsp. lavendulae]
MHRDPLSLRGPAGGASTLGLAFRPVTQTSGGLAPFPDRPERARRDPLEAARTDAASADPAGLPQAPAQVLPAVPPRAAAGVRPPS